MDALSSARRDLTRASSAIAEARAEVKIIWYVDADGMSEVMADLDDLQTKVELAITHLDAYQKTHTT